MTASIGFLSTLVTIMVGFTVLSPIVLLWFLLRDWREGTLW